MEQIIELLETIAQAGGYLRNQLEQENTVVAASLLEDLQAGIQKVAKLFGKGITLPVLPQIGLEDISKLDVWLDALETASCAGVHHLEAPGIQVLQDVLVGLDERGIELRAELRGLRVAFAGADWQVLIQPVAEAAVQQ